MSYGSSVYGTGHYGEPDVVAPEPTYTFIPPVRYVVPTTVPQRHPGNALFRYYQPRPEGINVYLLEGDILTQEWPYADAGVVRTFHGGHIHQVNLATALLLINAGYTVGGYRPVGRYGAGTYGGSYYGTAS